MTRSVRQSVGWSVCHKRAGSFTSFSYRSTCLYIPTYIHLPRFNIDNKYGRAALEATFKAIMGYEQPLVKPPSDYKGDFFKGKH